MPESTIQEAIFSKTMQTKGATYFFDVRQAQGGQKSKYVKLTESWMKDGQQKRSSITIFPDQLQAFTEAFEEAKAQAA